MVANKGESNGINSYDRNKDWGGERSGSNDGSQGNNGRESLVVVMTVT